VQTPACSGIVVVSGDPSTATRDSQWRIGSLTKTFVSATILSLEKDGKLTLDDLLAKWIPSVPKTDGVTLRHLLNHTSGIFNYTEDPSFFVDPAKKWPPSDLVAFATTHDPYFAPGAGWHYSNTNYILLGMIAQLAGGGTVGQLLHARAMGPAKLTHTLFDGEDAIGPMAKGFSKSKKDVTFLDDPSGSWAAGAMVATGIDLVQWASELYGTRDVLDDAEHDELVKGAVPTGTGETYGLGAFLLPPSETAGAGPAIGHAGDIDGYHTMAFWFPQKSWAIVSIVNQDGVDPNAILAAALLALLK
jgi:D-alanyl-D-alanine carboxypeptidase